MQDGALAELKDWFNGYVSRFRAEAPERQRNYDLKREHTFRVCHEIQGIGKELGLGAGDLRLAEATALLHDVGRFPQFARFGTFADRLSVDHAELSAQILLDEEVLAGLAHRTQDLILRVIRYHNRVQLPAEETGSCLFFARLLRDADKLDIWRVVTGYYHNEFGNRNSAIELDLPDTPDVSRKVCRSLLKRQIVDGARLENLNDFKLCQWGWLFDVNFRPTFQRVQQRRYMPLIRSALPETDIVESVFAVVQTYLDQQIASGDQDTRPWKTRSISAS